MSRGLTSIPDSQLLSRWNLLGLRAAYGQMLTLLAEDVERVVAVSADLGRSSGLDRFVEKFPSRYRGVGIAEQNMVGFCSGLAHQGFNVFCSSFAPFLSFRAAEQVRMNLGYMQSPVALVGMASGFALGFLGSSHYGLDDVGAMRAIAGIKIVEPADALELWKILVRQIEDPEPIYVRLTGTGSLSSFTREELLVEEPFETTSGSDNQALNVVSSGVLSSEVQSAALEVSQNLGVGIRHFHVGQIRPISNVLLEKLVSSGSPVLVVQEHSTVGGLGDELSRALQTHHLPVHIHGIPPGFPHGESYETSLRQNRLDPDGLRTVISDYAVKTGIATSRD